MNPNWYLAYEMFKQREAEMLRRLDRIKPWTTEEKKKGASGLFGAGVWHALGRSLLSWGNALSGSASKSCKDC
jgi:hypothetical protein